MSNKYSKTILYYSGNFKSIEFERKIQEVVLENCGDLPIISVTQKPTDFGHNICVGEHGRSYLNVYRQIYIGAQAVETDYIIMTEDDCLYPKEYFAYEPEGHDYYRWDNVWLLMKFGPYKRVPYAALIIAKRDYVVRVLEEGLKNHPEWIDNPRYKMFIPDIDVPEHAIRVVGPPVVIFKPDGNISRRGTVLSNKKLKNLEPWGRAASLKRIMGVI